MKLLSFALVGFTAFSIGCANAQSLPSEVSEPKDWSALSKEETFKAVASVVAGVNVSFTTTAPSSFPNMDWLQLDQIMMPIVEDALSRISALRDNLAGNPYLRVESFSVGVPGGVTVNFSFPPESTSRSP